MKAIRIGTGALGLLFALAAAGAPPAQKTGVFRNAIRTSDGTPVYLYRYVPDGGGLGARPVLLVPELGFSRAVFDAGDAGLARFLQRRGRDAFVLEPRGQGQSGAPEGWHLADVVAQDLPAALAEIQKVRDGPVDLVGYGWGGALAHAATPRELEGRVGRVVALSTPVAVEVPNEPTRSMLQRAAGFGDDAGAFELLFTRGGLFHPGIVSRVRDETRSLGPSASRELLGWMESGELPLPGAPLTARLARYDRPTFLILALADNFAHPEFASPLRDLAPSRVRVKLLSKLYLLREDYSHVSLVQGTEAPSDVFAPALEFLDARDGEAPKAAEGTR